MAPKAHFNGIERLAWGGLNANELGAILATLAAALVAVAVYPRMRPAVRLPVVLALALTLIALGATYSRGAWLALALAAGTSVAISRPSVKVLILAAIAIVPAIITTQHAVARIATVTTPVADASIGNRLKVWRGMSQLAADNWANGVGYLQLGAHYTTWYRPNHLSERYRTAVNTPLTVAAAWGLPACWVLLFITFFVLTGCLRAARSPGGLIQHVIGAAILCLFVAGLFSSFIDTWPFVLSYVCVLAGGAWKLFASRVAARQDAAIAAALAFGITISIVLVAWFFADQLRIRVIQDDSGERGAISITPSAPARGVVIYFQTGSTKGSSEILRVARDLASFGFQVIVPEPEVSPLVTAQRGMLGAHLLRDRCAVAVVAHDEAILAANRLLAQIPVRTLVHVSSSESIGLRADESSKTNQIFLRTDSRAASLRWIHREGHRDIFEILKLNAEVISDLLRQQGM